MVLTKTNTNSFAKILVYETDTDVELLGYGDFHIGATDFDKELLFKIPKMFPNAYLILIGDYFDFALKDSIGNIYEATMQPNEQVQVLDEFLETYKDRILGGVGGNHDYRLKKTTGIDIVKWIFDKYNVPYFDTTMIIDINLKGKASSSLRRLNYAIAVHHGVSGGRFPERSARQSRYFMDFISDVDVYISGHTRQSNMLPMRINRYDRHNKTISPITVHSVTVPSLVPEEKYAQRKMLHPTPLVYNIIRLKNGYKKTHID
jgi:hypothetical protein